MAKGKAVTSRNRIQLVDLVAPFPQIPHLEVQPTVDATYLEDLVSVVEDKTFSLL